MENAKLASDRNDKAIGTAREDLQEAYHRIESLNYQLGVLQKQVIILPTCTLIIFWHGVMVVRKSNVVRVCHLVYSEKVSFIAHPSEGSRLF